MNDPFCSPAAVKFYLRVRFKRFIGWVLFSNQNNRQLIEVLRKSRDISVRLDRVNALERAGHQPAGPTPSNGTAWSLHSQSAAFVAGVWSTWCPTTVLPALKR